MKTFTNEKFSRCLEIDFGKKIRTEFNPFEGKNEIEDKTGTY